MSVFSKIAQKEAIVLKKRPLKLPGNWKNRRRNAEEGNVDTGCPGPGIFRKQ